ncbi:16S rRNA (adenine(1518)-N(6)/adenine(1519)-N(6))-dimethyltransferase RsmA [Calothrix sp. NIES-3974]|uniref:16S rRNA (adenine(1518)-N(6)/adenine(1519)-N(6))- dimethyltransferase RsmA n=1 Tax=Calothrix sp. NIES-3974 TaxID=2005462 RepID=UPI000B5E52A8|nr:16S rRNA (adenine(1518)-N(6)/adenine(1519)-N(6))-dimethyltransferase RsmA [Calothrix sp. NIES-3974]BAZ08030.1 dimethyladenosine transferase [Calothrix sp. NIES-3974]
MVNPEKTVNKGKREVKPRRVHAQHWLRSDKALAEIITAAGCSTNDWILEIGPGTGVLTRCLLPLVEKLIAVEIDRGLVKCLQKEFTNKDNFLVVEGDFLEIDLDAFYQGVGIRKRVNKVVANIPYNITGPIIEKLLGRISSPNPYPYETIVLLVQKEVAERLVAKPGTKTFGALTVRVQYLAECEYISTVPAKAFYPAPKVDSAVVRLKPRQLQVVADDPKWLESLVKLGFSAKRKMLRNNLKSQVDGEKLTQVLEQLEINPQARAEDVSVEQWVQLSNLLTAKL